MTNIIIGFVLTVLSIGDALIGWISLFAMIFGLYSVTVYQRKQKQAATMQAKLNTLK